MAQGYSEPHSHTIAMEEKLIYPAAQFPCLAQKFPEEMAVF